MKLLFENDFKEVLKVLEPFANMHRKGCDPTEVACQRGTASDMTVLTSADFEAAYHLLKHLDSDYENASYY